VTPAEARYKRAARLVGLRAAERACAIDFLRHGDERGIHAKRCVFGEADACSRDYDPYPTAEATPDPRMYEGTAIGALYGFGTTAAWQLAGWNVRRHRRNA
jgi:hypothetical protein